VGVILKILQPKFSLKIWWELFKKEDLIGITINTLRNSFKNKSGLFYDKNINPNSFELVEIKETTIEMFLINETENEILDSIKEKLTPKEYEYITKYIPTKDKTKKSEKCCFVKSWVGNCNEHSNTTINGKHFCKKHSQLKCSKCGKQATHDCEQTIGSFVCGTLLCDDCKCH